MFPSSPLHDSLAILDSTSPTPAEPLADRWASFAADRCREMDQSNSRMYTASASSALSTRVAQYLKDVVQTPQRTPLKTNRYHSDDCGESRQPGVEPNSLLR